MDRNRAAKESELRGAGDSLAVGRLEVPRFTFKFLSWTNEYQIDDKQNNGPSECLCPNHLILRHCESAALHGKGLSRYDSIKDLAVGRLS